MYRAQRNYENLNKAIFNSNNEYGIPLLRPVTETDCTNWIGFNFARTCDEPDIHGVHFFLDDYQFNRVWTQPDTYLDMLSRFKAVCAPDFSTYTDFPKAIQIYNHYRKHWLGAYWQAHGLTVIPTISWSDEASYDWCFYGEPVGSVVALSSVGTQADPETKKLFIRGYREMMKRLKPTAIIMYGKTPEGCEGNIFNIRAFREEIRTRVPDRKRTPVSPEPTHQTPARSVGE